MNEYRGVSWHKLRQKFRVKIKRASKDFNLGYYRDSKKAARIYDCAALMLHGADAVLNFDGQPPPEVSRAVIVGKLMEQGLTQEQLYL